MESEQQQTISLSIPQLRRLKVLAEMSEEQLGVFLSLVDYMQVKPNRLIVKMHDNGDCMYLLLDGEVRVSQEADHRETVLAKLESGDFFGEMCLLEDGVRSADVVAIRDCALLRITKAAFQNVLETRPDIAARFLLAVMRVVSARIRTMDKRYQDSMLLSRFWHKGASAATGASASPSANH